MIRSGNAYVINSHVPAGFAQACQPGHEEYKPLVADKVMAAVDSMPVVYRRLVNDYDYVDVYRAWKCGISPQQIIANALANGGVYIHV